MKRLLCRDISRHIGERVLIQGWLEVARSLGSLHFIIVSDRSGSAQAVFEGTFAPPPVQSVVGVTGTVRQDERAPGGAELAAESLTEISRAEAGLPIEMNGRSQPGFEAVFEHRVLSMRNRRARAILKVSSEFVRAFREFFRSQGFVEVFTPKIVATGTEGGAELFEVKYFEKNAYLAQSPQLYKQMMVATGLERVYEVGPVFRAEEHNTSRHINQFTSLDIELGFIEDVEDVMRLEEQFLAFALAVIAETCAVELEALGVVVPVGGRVLRLDIDEARAMAKVSSGRDMPEGNLDPEGEKAVCQTVAEKTGGEFVFITGYPESVRPFYAMPDAARPGKTRSFDLLFRGLEVTTGGQRIHDHAMLVEHMLARGLDPARFRGYLEAFRFGMPPHGGLAIGAERFAARLLGLSNVREACTFPRDRTRLEP